MINLKKTAQEIKDYLDSDSDDLPDFTIEQMLLAHKGFDSFVEDEITFADRQDLAMPIPVSYEDIDKL